MPPRPSRHVPWRHDGRCPCAKVSRTTETFRATPQASVVQLFDRLYTSFRMRLFDAMGPRYGRILRDAEREVRFLSPEFDLDGLTDGNAPAVLDLMEATIRRAPFLRRAHLRSVACVLISDMYEKHYALLDTIGELTRVEDLYYRLKR